MAPPYLASRGDRQRTRHVKRFTPRLWSVDFARPMMAALTAPAPRTLRVDLDFLTGSDLAGVIWASEDRWSHPLTAYETRRDYREIRLRFDWVAGPGLMPLDALNGAVLTVEGRDAAGVPRIWYVRLWNHAEGTPMAAHVELDFGALTAGFGPGGEPVYAGDVDRMFISLVPDGFDGSGAPLPLPVSTWVELREVISEGRGAAIALGDAFLPEHRLRICSGYDDSYNQAPERLVEQWLQLGYRDLVNHYVGMSHYPALGAAGGRFEVTGGLCAAAEAWHRAFARALVEAGMTLILSLSFELFDDNAPAAWAQRTLAGERALTGWVPPSTLLSPCNAEAMAWLGGIAAAFAALAAAEAGQVHFQVGEPWWWVGPEGAPCFYDAATVAAWAAEAGSPPPAMTDVRGPRTTAEETWLDWLGAKLAAATAGLRVAAAGAAGTAPFRAYLLFYAPQVLDARSPQLIRANMPTGWAAPAFDVLQLEDYDFVTAGDEGGMQRARAAVSDRLGYPLTAQQYLAGFVLTAAQAGVAWPRIADAAAAAMGRGVPEVLVWAWPQVARDGFTWIELGEGDGGSDGMEAFHDVRFPLELGFDAVGGPQFETQVALLASGHEQRNQQWASARLSYDAGLGVRSDADLVQLLTFFRARRGQAFAFRFRDPMDWQSGFQGVSALDQPLGTGDGVTLGFALAKHYGAPGEAEVRRITRPVATSVVVAVDGVARADGWTLLPGGIVQFEMPPAAGAVLTAGFEFDVPVRFASDRLDISLSGWRQGDVPSAPMIEVRE